jgi:mRNA interferase HigB
VNDWFVLGREARSHGLRDICNTNGYRSHAVLSALAVQAHQQERFISLDIVTKLATLDYAPMRIITRKFLDEAKHIHPKARAPLDHWYRITLAALWDSFAQCRQTFGHADQVPVKSKRTVTVFNITNDFRLITAIHYNRHEVFTMRFMTHAEYDKGVWKSTL